MPPLPETLDLGDGIVWDIIEYPIKAPTADRPYRFAVINDLHIIVDSDEILDEKREEVDARRDTLFIDRDGTRSADAWQRLAPLIDGLSVDGVIIAGDLTDFYSEANKRAIEEGLSRIKTPYIYLRADHDISGRKTGLDKDTITVEEEDLCPNEPVMALEYPGLAIVGLNDSTSQMTEEGVGMLEEILEDKERAVLLFTHVPFEPEKDTRLAAASFEAWQDRSLLWGPDSYYVPDANTQRAIDLICGEGSPVQAVFAGHLHFRYDGPLTGSVKQHVLDANYKGNISVLTVMP